MAKGIAKIAEQVDNYGFFGSIEVECTTNKKSMSIKIEIDEKLKRWEPGILFGSNYFIEHITDEIGLVVKITNMEYHEVDTNNAVVAYLTVVALANATKLSLKKDIFFDKANKSFVFPK